MKVKKSYFIYERLEDIKTYIKEGEKDKNNTHNTMQSYEQYAQTLPEDQDMTLPEGQ